jgi:hypothetical protein
MAADICYVDFDLCYQVIVQSHSSVAGRESKGIVYWVTELSCYSNTLKERHHFLQKFPAACSFGRIFAETPTTRIDFIHLISLHEYTHHYFSMSGEAITDCVRPRSQQPMVASRMTEQPIFVIELTYSLRSVSCVQIPNAPMHAHMHPSSPSQHYGIYAHGSLLLRKPHEWLNRDGEASFA